MVESLWGRIINIPVGERPERAVRPDELSTAKAGMLGFTMSLAREVATKGVTVNTVSPGYIGTDMVKVSDICPGSAREDRRDDSGALPRPSRRSRLDRGVAGIGRVGLLDGCGLLAERRAAHGLTARAPVKKRRGSEQKPG